MKGLTDTQKANLEAYRAAHKARALESTVADEAGIKINVAALKEYRKAYGTRESEATVYQEVDRAEDIAAATQQLQTKKANREKMEQQEQERAKEQDKKIAAEKNASKDIATLENSASSIPALRAAFISRMRETPQYTAEWILEKSSKARKNVARLAESLRSGHLVRRTDLESLKNPDDAIALYYMREYGLGGIKQNTGKATLALMAAVKLEKTEGGSHAATVLQKRAAAAPSAAR